ncbi:MAG: bifunctional glutamate N-acetyltransferase/amino-acid acetyltransferase ArgJ [Ectothiorhodospiraceae bacterium]|nr:bifunctional glutamate N-acetyltransferase/amino-acid acetyltransferase ArgJ [Chromatiales bacterium]MCP5153936.1 bifunctional glutamate N-acetyltransferase/amino-acid acetyltransferase ArgJ [Ectothiorhodospiraceae bacterium]
MAVGLDGSLDLAPVAGVRVGGAELGGRKKPRTDLAIIELAEGTQTAATFTRNRFCAAPVTVARRHLAAAAPRYLMVNAGNANAATGEGGIADAVACCGMLAAAAGCGEEAVLPFSTGVIGERLVLERFERAIPVALQSLATDGWTAGAHAIMTTDTVPKGRSATFTAGGKRCTVTGIAKGVGMIKPDMATMLAFVATDAAVAPELLRECLEKVVGRTFNRVTVDGDTSTNDSCVLAATGRAGNPVIDAAEHADYDAFEGAVDEVCRWLAHALVRDGEGATKFVTVEVGGGRTERECRDVAYAVAESPLVKTALSASDANWGRIVMAIGRSAPVDLDQGTVSVWLGDVLVVDRGGRADSYREELGASVLAGEEVRIRVDLGRGDASCTVWTCDLSHEYVSINADYRT